MNENGHRTGDTKQNPALSGQWFVSPRHPSHSVRPETGSWNNHRGVSGPTRSNSVPKALKELSETLKNSSGSSPETCREPIRIPEKYRKSFRIHISRPFF